MSNCVLRSRGSRLPCKIVADHGIEGSDHLSHDGDDNYFGFLVGRGETVVEDLEGGIVSGCAEGSNTWTSNRSFATSIPPLAMLCHLRAPSLLMRAHALATVREWKKRWSAKLIRGLSAEAAAGFQSKRGRWRESTPVNPHYAAFATYKTAQLH